MATCDVVLTTLHIAGQPYSVNIPLKHGESIKIRLLPERADSFGVQWEEA